MATEAERELLHEKAQYLRNTVSLWLNGPRQGKVKALADELDIVSGHLQAPEPDTGSASVDEGGAQADTG